MPPITRNVAAFKGLVSQFEKAFRGPSQIGLRLDPSAQRKFGELGVNPGFLAKLFIRTDKAGEVGFAFRDEPGINIALGSRHDYVSADQKLRRPYRLLLKALIENAVRAREILKNPSDLKHLAKVVANRFATLESRIARAPETDLFDVVQSSKIMLEDFEPADFSPTKLAKQLSAALLFANARSGPEKGIGDTANQILDTYFKSIDLSNQRLAMVGDIPGFSERSEGYVSEEIVPMAKFLVSVLKDLPKALSREHLTRLKESLAPSSAYSASVPVLNEIDKHLGLETTVKVKSSAEIKTLTPKQAAYEINSFANTNFVGEGEHQFMELRIKAPYDMAGSINVRKNSLDNSFAKGAIKREEFSPSQEISYPVRVGVYREGTQQVIYMTMQDGSKKSQILSRSLVRNKSDKSKTKSFQQQDLQTMERNLRSFIERNEFSENAERFGAGVSSTLAGLNERMESFYTDLESRLGYFAKEPDMVPLRKFFPSFYRSDRVFGQTEEGNKHFHSVDVKRIAALIAKAANTTGAGSTANKKAARQMLNKMLELFVFNLNLLPLINSQPRRLDLGSNKRMASDQEVFMDTITSFADFNAYVYGRLKRTPGAGSNIFRHYAYQLQQAVKNTRLGLEESGSSSRLTERMKNMEDTFAKRFRLERLRAERRPFLRSQLDKIWRNSKAFKLLNKMTAIRRGADGARGFLVNNNSLV